MSDMRPENCRFRLQDEGKAYPRSMCKGCNTHVFNGLGKECKRRVFDPEAVKYFEQHTDFARKQRLDPLKVAGEVRMLMRDDFRHEPKVVAARDVIAMLYMDLRNAHDTIRGLEIEIESLHQESAGEDL